MAATLLRVTGDELTITRWGRLLYLTFPMLWPSATINYGGHGPQIASLWHQKCVGHRPQLTMATKGHKWPLCDLNLTKKWPILRRAIIRNHWAATCGGCRCRCLWTNYSPVRHICIPMLTDPYVKIEWKKILLPSLRDVIKENLVPNISKEYGLTFKMHGRHGCKCYPRCAEKGTTLPLVLMVGMNKCS